MPRFVAVDLRVDRLSVPYDERSVETELDRYKQIGESASATWRLRGRSVGPADMMETHQVGQRPVADRNTHQDDNHLTGPSQLGGE